MRNLSADSSYLIKLAAQNEFGMGEFDQYHSAVQTLKVRPCFYRIILKIKFTGQIYRYFLWLEIFTDQIYQYFLWLEKSPLTYLINKEDEINEDGGHIVLFITWKSVKKGGKIWENNKADIIENL